MSVIIATDAKSPSFTRQVDIGFDDELYVCAFVECNVKRFMASYIKPGDVHAPKRHWQLIHVLFDGGESGPDSNGGSSLAIGRWDGRPVLAMRWNGNKRNPLGNPQSRGLPTWFIVPDQHVRQILETTPYNFSDSRLKFARDFLDALKAYFLSPCPTPGCRNFKNLTLQSYASEECGEHLKALDAGNPMFYCIYCDHQWQPTEEEKVRLAAELQSTWDNYCSRR